jgi:hypothetical protein
VIWAYHLKTLQRKLRLLILRESASMFGGGQADGARTVGLIRCFRVVKEGAEEPSI